MKSNVKMANVVALRKSVEELCVLNGAFSVEFFMMHFPFNKSFCV